MAKNNGFIDFLSENALKDMREGNKLVLEAIGNIETLNKRMSGANTPMQSDSFQKQIAKDYLELQEVLRQVQIKYAALAAAQRNNITITNSQSGVISKNTAATRENSIANQILRAETDRNFRSNTLLAGAYARASARLLILKKEAKDAAITFGEQSIQAKRAAAAAIELDGRIKAADKSVGDYQRNVGNYANGVVSGFKSIFSYARQLAYVLPGIGIAGIFSLALDPLYELIKGLGLFNDKFMEMKKNFDAFREAQTKIRLETRATKEDFKQLYELATAAGNPEGQSQAIKKLKTDYQSFFGAYSDGAIKSGAAAKEFVKVNESLEAVQIVQKKTDLKKQTEERIDLITQELAARVNFNQESKRLEQEMKQNTIVQNAGTKGAKTILNPEGEAALADLNTLKKLRQDQKQSLIDKKEENILYGSTIKLNVDLAKLNLNRQSAQEEINEYLGKSLLLEKDINKEKRDGRQYDPQGAVLDARIRYLKELTEATNAEYEVSKKNKELEISNLEELATNEKLTYQTRINAYGEMLKKKQDLAGDDFLRAKAQLSERLKIELDEADKAYNAELKKAAPANASKRTEEQQAAIVKITELHEGEKLSIRLKYQDLEEQSDLDNSKVVQGIAKQTSDGIIKIEEERNKILLSTDKIYRDEQISNFKKTADNEKLSVEIRQEAFRAYIALKQKQIDIDKAAELLQSNGSKEQYDNIIARYEGLQNVLNNEGETESPFAKSLEHANSELESLKKNLQSDFFKDAGLSSLTKFADGTFKGIMDGFDLITDKTQQWGKIMSVEQEQFLKKFQYTFAAVSDIASEVLSFIDKKQQAGYDAELSRLDKKKEIEILFAGDSATGRAEIERQYDIKRRAIQKKQAEAEKRNALFSIILHTATAVVSALPDLLLAGIVAGLGLIEYGIAAATPIPEFYKGTDNAPEGWAKVDEKGAEIHTDKLGNIKSFGSDKGANFRYLAAGDIIKTADKSRDMLMFNRDLNGLLANNGIANPVVNVNGGLSKQDMRDVMEDAMRRIPQSDGLIMQYDEGGLNMFKTNKGKVEQMLNSKIRFNSKR